MGSDTDMAKFARELCKDYTVNIASIGVCQITAFRNEEPAHTVVLDSYWIDRTTDLHTNSRNTWLPSKRPRFVSLK